MANKKHIGIKHLSKATFGKLNPDEKVEIFVSDYYVPQKRNKQEAAKAHAVQHHTAHQRWQQRCAILPKNGRSVRENRHSQGIGRQPNSQQRFS